MMSKMTMMLVGAALAFGASTTGASADACSGHSHAGGTILGAIAGGVIGGAVSHGNGGAVVGGAIVGGLAGNAISRDIDCEDRDYAYRSYNDSFDGDVGRHYEWHHGEHHGYIVTTREYRRHGHLCRDFEQVTYRHGREVVREGTACRRHGEWELI